MNQGQPKKQLNTKRPPFWLPAISYYFLVMGLAAGTFFLTVLVFQPGPNEVELVTAGLISSGVLVIGVVVREVVLRNARERHLARRRMLDRNLSNVPTKSDEYPIGNKFSLEDNSIAIEAIRAKSNAAKVFGRLATGHREVFEMCQEYRRIVSAEIPKTHPDSPRLKAMIKGKHLVGRLQEFHLLSWAEIESTEYAEKAFASQNEHERAEHAAKARNVINVALRYYPENAQLRESESYLANLADPMNKGN